MSQFTTGLWWEPGQPERQIHGVLVKEQENRWRLQLDGILQDLQSLPAKDADTVVSGGPLTAPGDYEVLLGLTSQGRPVTLFKCAVLSSTLTGWPNPSMVISPVIIVYGVHFRSANDFRLTSLSVRCSNVDAWADTSGFVVEFDPSKTHSVSVQYTLPKSLEAQLPNSCVIEVGFAAKGPLLTSPLTEVNISQRVWLTISPPEAWPFDELLRISSVFSDFVALSIGQPVRPLEIRGTCDAQSEAKSSATLEVVHNYEPIAPVVSDVHIVDMVFTLGDIRTRFGHLLRLWFTKQESIKPLYELYFATIRSPRMYVEHRFLNMFQALESYDRRVHEIPQEKQRSHQERLGRVLNAVGDRDREWLEGKLRYSHEPSAMKRLLRLVDSLDAKWLFDDPRADLELAANLRNFRTHFDLKLEERLPPKEERATCMYNLAVRLQMLCELALLHETGFSIQEVRQRMEATQRLERRLVS